MLTRNVFSGVLYIYSSDKTNAQKMGDIHKSQYLQLQDCPQKCLL